MSLLLDAPSSAQGLLLIPGMTGGMELLVILAVVLLLFGGRIPSVARSLGRGITEFKRGIREKPEDSDEEPKKIEESQQQREGSER
ncbi:MAG: twin-arginine translocase TatA/TatE family subunit [Planctomycetota bacterium]